MRDRHADRNTVAGVVRAHVALRDLGRDLGGIWVRSWNASRAVRPAASAVVGARLVFADGTRTSSPIGDTPRLGAAHRLLTLATGAREGRLRPGPPDLLDSRRRPSADRDGWRCKAAARAGRSRPRRGLAGRDDAAQRQGRAGIWPGQALRPKRASHCATNDALYAARMRARCTISSPASARA